ncbi:MAG: TlpA family protein disulfide reductase [Clostridia bacterium]|nr:TlpA family protein disulfide reductase [Clostridia bacterium]
MSKKLFSALLLIALSLFLLCASAAAQDVSAQPGNVPERGVILPMTADDVNMGLSVSHVMGSTQDIRNLPLFFLTYSDLESLQVILERYQDADLSDQQTLNKAYEEMLACTYTVYSVLLFEEAYYDAKTAGAKTPEEAFAAPGAYLLGRNGGYAYLVVSHQNTLSYPDEAVKARVDQACVRMKELLDGIIFQDIVFAPSEIAAMSNAFPAFTTQDLNGNTVTNDIFSEKDLTVVNIWGTYCGPCINEMPDLAAWSSSMPENAQLIGLVCDLGSADDTETLETAKSICEATGASYTSLIANQDFAELLYGVVGVPTTLFVDREGLLVGEPIVGANVQACKAFAEEYLNAL